jgi:hypothetical protein
MVELVGGARAPGFEPRLGPLFAAHAAEPQARHRSAHRGPPPTCSPRPPSSSVCSPPPPARRQRGRAAWTAPQASAAAPCPRPARATGGCCPRRTPTAPCPPSTSWSWRWAGRVCVCVLLQTRALHPEGTRARSSQRPPPHAPREPLVFLPPPQPPQTVLRPRHAARCDPLGAVPLGDAGGRPLRRPRGARGGARRGGAGGGRGGGGGWLLWGGRRPLRRPGSACGGAFVWASGRTAGAASRAASWPLGAASPGPGPDGWPCICASWRPRNRSPTPLPPLHSTPQVLLDVACAINHLHGLGLVHGDVKVRAGAAFLSRAPKFVALEGGGQEKMATSPSPVPRPNPQPPTLKPPNPQHPKLTNSQTPETPSWKTSC